MILLLDLLFVLLLVGLSPAWLVLFLLRPNFRATVLARARNPGPGAPLEGAIWLHGSSAGEIDLLRPLVARLEERHPDAPIVISTFAVSGYAAATRAFPRHRVIFLPPEFSPLIRRALRRLDPRLFVLVETELWPNLMLTLTRAGVPMCLLNGKMSDRSLARYRRFGVMRRAAGQLAVVAVQSAEHAERFRALGVAAARVHVTGNMKYDLTPPADGGTDRQALREAYGIEDGIPVIIAGSIHPGEDDAVAAAASKLLDEGRDFRLVVVPRYPTDADAADAALAEQGFDAIRRSAGPSTLENRTALVVDTMGELKRFYAMSDIAFVGGSLHYRGSNKGGHNLMEPAVLGVAVIFGPWNLSFRETADDMLAADAGRLVRDAGALHTALSALLDEPDAAAEAGRRARDLVLRNQGATDRNLALLEACLEPVAPQRPRDPGPALAGSRRAGDNGAFVKPTGTDKP